MADVVSAPPTSTVNGDDDKDASSDPSSPLFETLGKGIVRDYKTRLPLYWSDVRDGISMQCVAASMFLFFACLAPAVGFGGLFAKATGGAIGTIEMVTSTAVCGVLYALLAAQPLTIIGSTGPVLAFVACLVPLAQAFNLPFLPLYAWTGLWTGGILAALAVTSGSNLVKYLTRFTDEIFSTLISTIFIVEAVSDVARTFVSPASTFTKALLTLVCAFLTYSVSTALKGFRKTIYLNKTARKTVSNFAPTIGVAASSLVARWARLSQGSSVAALPALTIPDAFGTTSGRPWLVPIWDLPAWARWASVLPAVMATVLLFLDQNITVRLVNNPRFRMTKGRRKRNVVDGMHADLLVIALLTIAQSLFGIPWLVAATVRSLSHVGALSQYDESGKIVGTVEQRVTGVVIHALIGCCVLFVGPRMLLKQVPLPVLMGLFMYLGASALPGNEMWERFKELFQEGRLLPVERRWATVPRKVTNLFTMIQVVLLVAMFGVKESRIGVLFPVIIALLAPIRFGLEKTGIIKAEYMDMLDEE
jgi:hypothetical protein